MDEDTVNAILRNDDCFRGCFPRDRLPKVTQYPSSYIINTDPHDEPGEHWVAVHFYSKNKAEYFDSYGLPPFHEDIQDFLNRNAHSSTYFPRRLQTPHPLSIVCGFYAILFIRCKCLSFSLVEFYKIFSDNSLVNDKLVPLFVLLSQ